MKYKKKKVRLSSFFVNSKRGLYLWNAINKSSGLDIGREVPLPR